MIDLKELVLMSKEEYDSIEKREEIVREAYSERVGELEDINVLQSNRIDELTGVLKGLYIAVVCGLPLEDQLRRVRETVDTDEDKREPNESRQ